MTDINAASLKVGDEIPALQLAPISRTTLALYAGASGDHNPIHIDLDFAKKYGLPDVIAHGMLVMAYAGRMLTNWVPQSTLKTYGVRFSSMIQIHAEITCTGRVAAIDDNGDVTVELQAADQNGDIKLSGTAVLGLAA